jgi:hypothetical protein
LSVVTTSAAIGQRIVEGLCGCGCACGHISDELGIKGCVCVSHNTGVATAAAFSLDLNVLAELVTHGGNILTHKGKAVLSALVMHCLMAKSISNIFKLSVDVLVQRKPVIFCCVSAAEIGNFCLCVNEGFLCPIS